MKMDLGINLVTGTPGTSPRAEGIQQQYSGLPVKHMFMATEITEKGLAMMADYVAAVRESVGVERSDLRRSFRPLERQ
jgi:hypothetical protein